MTLNARFWLIATLVAGGLVYLLAPVLTPFVISALLAYLASPLVRRLERMPVGIRRLYLGRTGAVALVFVFMIVTLALVLLLLIPMLERQVVRLVSNVPAMIVWLQETAIPWLSDRLGLSMRDLDREGLTGMLSENWSSAGGVATTVLAGVSKSGMALIGWLINLVLIPVVTFYLLRDWEVLLARVRTMLPRPIEPTVLKLARESDHVLGAFLRGQLLVMLALATLYSVGLWLVGVDLALLIGVVAGLISFVPYLGTIVGVGAGVVATLVQHGDMGHLVAVLIVFGIGQAAEGMLLQPVLLGDRIGLHPVAVIFAVLAGGQLFGFLGILLALPVAAVLMVVLRHLYQRYEESQVYVGDDPRPSVVLPGDPEPAPAVTHTSGSPTTTETE
ncbi:MAG: AI-2E family transporter [Xanthomonadales bacterium]|nr:AI-2E family transporter [Xanthomonadales bacterium]